MNAEERELFQRRTDALVREWQIRRRRELIVFVLQLTVLVLWATAVVIVIATRS